MIAQLLPVDGGPPIPIHRDVTLVGRDRQECDLFVNQPSISKLHCLIVKTDGLLFVRDLGSTNGTKVNGQKIIRGALLPGDQLAFANVRFRVHLGPGEPENVNHGKTEFLVIPDSISKSPLNGTDQEESFGPLEPLASLPIPERPLSRQPVERNSDSDVRLLTEEELAEEEDD